MNNTNKPFLAERLGVEVEQEFTFDGHIGFIYRINSDGRRQHRTGIHPVGNQWKDCSGEDVLTFMLDHPECVHPFPRWTEDDIADAASVRRLYSECKWVARDKNGELWIYGEQPIKRESAFDKVPGSLCEEMPTITFPSVTWENSPVELAGIR